MNLDLRSPKQIRRENIRHAVLGLIGFAAIIATVFAASYSAAGSQFIRSQAVHPDCMGDAKC